MSKHSGRTSVTIITLVVLGLTGFIWHRLHASEQPGTSARPLPLVQIRPPAQVDLERKLQLTADVLPIQQADLMAKIAGYLDAIYVDRGDRVRAGQVLAIISQPELTHQLREAEANYDYAKISYERLEELFGKNLVAKQNVDDARNKYDVARRTLDLQRTYVEYGKIVAPFDGYITKRYVDPGALVPQATGFVSTTSTVVTVMDLSQVKVLVNVPERDVASVRLHDEVSLTADAYPDQTFHGRVTKFAPALDPGSRTLQVEIDVSNQDLVLKPGMFARVTLVLERRPQALAVPSEALLVNELGSFIYTVGGSDDGVATVRRVAVRTGIEDGGQVEILVGIGPDDHVVSAGKELIHDGTRVRVSEDGMRPTRTAER